uniref:DC1 domain-containing protein n=1 Tax=Leersia perrieri TaxID=77586 RepID=A0A0D9X7L3_9ORYZ
MSQPHDHPAVITGHLSHPDHNLRLVTPAEDGHWPPRCGGCKEPRAGRSYYKCKDPACEFTLYMCCATAPASIDHHPLFPGCEFRLLKQPPPPPPWLAGCDACGDLLHGLAYDCSERGLDLHPRCARLPADATAVREVAGSGGYTVQLVRSHGGRRCGICMSSGYCHGFWSCRFSGEGRKVFDLHLSCLKEFASESHQTLSNFYKILMGCSVDQLWMTTNNSVMPAQEDEEEIQFQEGVNNATMVPDTITHPSHPNHKLTMVKCDTPFQCIACKEPGVGPRYHCHACDLNIHKFCAEAPVTLHPSLFEGRTFTLLCEPPHCPPEPPYPVAKQRRCDICGDSVGGLVYHCPGANLDLHPCCASLFLQPVAGPGPVDAGSVLLCLCGPHVGRLFLAKRS